MLKIGQLYQSIDKREYFIRPNQEKYVSIVKTLKAIESNIEHYDYFFWPPKILYGKILLLVGKEMNGPNVLYAWLCENKMYYTPLGDEEEFYKEIEANEST